MAHGVNAFGADAHAVSETPDTLRFSCRSVTAGALAGRKRDDRVVALAIGAARPRRFLECGYRQEAFHKDLE